MLQTSFRKVMVAAALSLPLVSLNLQSALADQRDFTVINKTSTPIRSLYVSPTGENDWEEDVLGRDVLPKGQSTQITFSGREKLCSYDIKAVFDDGDSVEDYKIDLCKTDSYTFTER